MPPGPSLAVSGLIRVKRHVELYVRCSPALVSCRHLHRGVGSSYHRWVIDEAVSVRNIHASQENSARYVGGARYIKTPLDTLRSLFFIPSSVQPTTSTKPSIQATSRFPKHIPLPRCLPATATPAPAPTASATAAPAAPVATKLPSTIHNACSNISTVRMKSNDINDNTRPSPSFRITPPVSSDWSMYCSASPEHHSPSWGLDHPIRVGGRGPGSFGGYGAWRGY